MGKDQEFLDAARNGNITYIEKVLNQRAKRAGPLASLRRGPGVNVQDSGGYSALHHACLNGHSDIVRLLLNNEASPNLPDSRGSSPLHLAAWAGQQDIVKMLLTHSYKPALPNMQTIENETPLHCAAQHGHTGALAVLLAHNADPNMRNSRGETPLDLAAQYGRLQAVQMLIRAHPELIAHYSVAAIEGVPGGSGSGVGLQRQKSRHSSPLPHSGSVSTPSPSSPSITSSPATPTRNIFPHTCLHVASRNGHKNVVEVLLAAGVSVNLLTPSGTALHEAALCGKESVVRTLLRAGIDLNATDAEGRTALDILREFPPHVTKHIIAVINNFRNQMDVDDSEDVVVFRHQHPPPPPPQRQSSSLSYYQKQQHNNHYHFNSNNHLLNHAHSLQQSSTYAGNNGGGGGGGGNVGGAGSGSSGGGNTNKHRYGINLNGGKSLDSGLQPDHYGIGGRAGYHEVNSPVHSTSNNSQNELGVSPSSSMSSFEPVSVSPRSRSSTGGIVAITVNNPMHMSTFAPAAPPKKPPRRNLSVSPTHSGQQFSYTSPNHQQQQSARMHQQHHSPSTESPYSGGHQSHGSMGGMSFDETTQLRDRQRGDRLYGSARESGGRSETGTLLTSSSNDMLERMNYSSEERADSADGIATSNSMKRPLNKSRDVSTDIINCENPTLKSYNPNRKLKRNRNSYSLSISDTKENKNDPKPLTPLSPTHYQQPPTPDHPPPSSSHAERTIHERIRPLSMEYKRRSALIQLQQQQQHIHSKSMIDSSTSPAKHWQAALIPTPTFDYPVGSLSPKLSANASPTTTIMNARRIGTGIRGSSGSLSSSVSLSDHSLSTDCVEEFVGDAPFAGLFKGSSVNLRHEKRTMGNRKLGIPSTSARSASASAAEDQQQQQQKQQRTRPPIPVKPLIPDCNKMIKTLAVTGKDLKVQGVQEGCNDTNKAGDNTSHVSQNVSICLEGENGNGTENDGDNGNSNSNGNSNGNGNGNGNEDIEAALSAITTATTQSSGILSPFNAEEARKKISEIIESFGSGILNSTLTPTTDIELEFDEAIEPVERRELALGLRNVGLLHLERMLFENGYDNFKFVNGVFEPSDTQLMDIQTPDANKLISFVRTLPKAEFQPQVLVTNKPKERKVDNNGDTTIEKSGVATLSDWLQSISLPEYIESFSKHLYNTIDSVCGVWDVELQTVLEINKLGHRRRILQSVAFIRQIREPNKSDKSGDVDNNEITKIGPSENGECGNKEPRPKSKQQAQPQQRTSLTGYRKNRPAPQPPTEKSQQPQLQIRAPSELLLGLPANLRTKWRHSANVLLNEQIKYEVYYLGSTVVKELRGTESTRKSIQKLKRDDNVEEQQKVSRSAKINRKKPAMVCLAISHLGVEFIDVISKHTICEHEIQNINCACQDSDDLRHFAYITKDLDTHYCHVFYVKTTDLATDIILTLGQAFEVAYQLALRDGITQTPAAAFSGNSLLSGASTGEPVTAE